MCIRDRYMRIYCHDQHYKWAEYLPFFEKSINENYSEATGYPPIEPAEGQKPTRFWKNFISKPENQNLPIPTSQKLGNARNRIKGKGMKRIKRFNQTHKLVEFKVGDIVFIRSNPVGKLSLIHI